MTARLAKLFTDKGDTLTTRTYHTGLLWGLEALAWAPEYMPRAAEALMKLDEIDPGGRLSNRPAKSLVDIFRPWFPQTSAPVNTRLAVLRALASRHPDHTLPLLIALLPERMGVATHNYLPRFRQWGQPPQSVPAKDYWELVDGVVVLLVNLLGDHPERWVDLTEKIPDLPATRRTDIYNRLLALADDQQIDSSIKLQIWSSLEEMVRQHRTFADARWALPEADLLQIERVAERLQPKDLVLQHSWLFDSQRPDIGPSKRDLDFPAYEAELEQLRSSALREIVAGLGLEGVYRLIDKASESLIVGRSVADAWAEAPEDAILSELDSKDIKRAGASMGFAFRRAEREGAAWIDRMVPGLAGRPVAQARLIRAFPSFEGAWQRLEKLDKTVEQAYWAEFVPYGLGDAAGLVAEIARRLIAHGRPGTAADLLHLYVGRADPPIDPELVASALEGAIDAGSPELARLANYGIRLLLDYLRSSSYDEDRLGILESRAFPALGYGAQSPVLEQRLGRDPAFFVQILSLVYKRADGTKKEVVRPEIAQNAFHLLQEWRVVPGSSKRGGPIDEGRLREWLSEVRRLLREANREDIGLHEIGKVFAYSSDESDGTWPTLPVRNAIESLASDDVDAGFINGIYNKRGVTTRGLTDGGRQEYELADTFENFASKLMNEWPRTGALLRSVSEGYRIQGRREDEEARQFIEGLDR